MLIPNLKTNVVHYLLERGLLKAHTVVNGDLIVAELTSRHRNYAVILNDEPGFFVKHAQSWQPVSVQTLQREAVCYALVQQEPSLARIATSMPKYYTYDSVRNCLVLEWIRNAENLANYHRRVSAFPPSVAAHLGRMLASLHSVDCSCLAKVEYQGVFTKQTPWVLSFHNVQPATVQNLSAANALFMSILQRYPGFGRTLEGIRQQWKTRSLIHGDIKFENCIISANTNSDADNQIRIIDWELADIGDPCWDVGAVFQAYITWWVCSIPVGDGPLPDDLDGAARCPIDQMRPALQSFWDAYIDHTDITAAARPQFLEVCVSCAAARMLQTVFESMYVASQLAPSAILLMQASLNILQNPAQAIADLLCLDKVAA